MGMGAARGFMAAGEGISNMGTALINVLKQQREEEQRAAEMAAEESRFGRQMDFQRESMAGADRRASEDRRANLAMRGFSETETPDAENLGELAAGAVAGPMGMAQRIANIVRNGGQMQRREIAYNADRDPEAIGRRETFDFQGREGAANRTSQERISSGNNATSVRVAGIGADAQLGSARISAAARPPGEDPRYAEAQGYVRMQVLRGTSPDDAVRLGKQMYPSVPAGIINGAVADAIDRGALIGQRQRSNQAPSLSEIRGSAAPPPPRAANRKPSGESAASTPRQQITADQAEFLRRTRGMTDTEINSQFTVR